MINNKETESVDDNYIKAFYQYINSNDDILEISNYDDICNITGSKLEEKYIKLNCGHKFNYEPLYQETINQKIKKSYYSSIKLNINQLQCPYCRSVQNEILPRFKNTKRSNQCH